MNLLYLWWQLLSQRGETSPLHQQLPQSSVKQGKKKQDTHNVVNIATKVFMICICRLNLPFLCCRRLQLQHRSAATVKHMRWIRETNSLWNRERFLVCVLTMPTQVLVIQGLESSFLYTSNFPLVSPTTSSFNYSEWRQTAHSFCYNMEETNI